MCHFCVRRYGIVVIFLIRFNSNIDLSDGTVQEYLDGMFSDVLAEWKDVPNSQVSLHELGRRIVFASLPGKKTETFGYRDIDTLSL